MRRRHLRPTVSASGTDNNGRCVTAPWGSPKARSSGSWGPNGAGKTTLLNLAVGLLAPTCGAITVLGGRPSDGPAQLEKVGFVAQDTPAYAGLSVGKHLLMGSYLNANWNQELAKDPDRPARPGRAAEGRSSRRQRAQLALTMAIAKQPAAASP